MLGQSEALLDNYDEGSGNHCERVPKLTEKMKEFQVVEAQKQESKFARAYDAFKKELASARQTVRADCTEDTLHTLIECIRAKYVSILKTYENLRSHASHIKDIATHQRQIDSATACKNDLISYLNQRVCQIGVKEFDAEEENTHLKGLKTSYAASVYSAATKRSFGSECSRDSGRSIKAQAVEAAADLAAKQIRLQSLEVKEKERTRLAELEARKSRQNLELEQEIESQRRRLELLEAKHDVQEINARCSILQAAANNDDGDGSEAGDELDNIPSHVSTLNPSVQPFTPQRPSTAITVHSSDGSRSVDESSFAQILVNVMNQSRLPVPVPKVFNGNPMEFVAFRGSFKTLIEDKGISAKEKIYYLQLCVTGEAKEAIDGCLYGTTEDDYARAWQTLESRYGHQFLIQESFRERLEQWPRIGPKDNNALQRYADFLRCCLDATTHTKGLSILNDFKENQKLAAKLPDWLVVRWSRQVADSLDDKQEYPSFQDFVGFVQKEARIVTNPIMSLAAVRHNDKSKGMARTAFSTRAHEDKQNETSRFQESHEGLPTKGRSFNSTNTEKLESCPFCSGDHYLSSCTVFGERAIDERYSFIRNQKRCFGCLTVGHVVKQCKVRHICQRCKGRHPTVLHDDDRKHTEKDPTVQELRQTSVVSLSTEHGNSGTTNVVPVWVSTANNPCVEKLVYALLDTQSDSTFIDERLCEELLVSTEPVRLKLTTMVGNGVDVACKRVESLRVRGYTSSQYIDLPPTYTQNSIPLDREHIPTRDTAMAWNHLKAIATEMPPLMDCEVGLLIGYNCSAALAPRQFIVGEIGEPYAIKTDLGWSVVGPSGDFTDVTGFCHRVSVKEVPAVAPSDILKILESDFHDTNQSDVSMSQDDIRFLQILEGSVTRNTKGHIEMPLPFKVRPQLPNNRSLATRRLFHLKGRLLKDPKYKEDYAQYMDHMIKDGDAELASEDTLPGCINYLSHHGVYHPKKPDKLRVVFDCSARFKGSSLNDHLLSGPDLTNSLLGVLCRFRRHPVAIMCDVEKMFHRFHVCPEDRDYLRFLWWEGGDINKEPLDYRMNVHLFGASSSPGCANFGLKHLARVHEQEYPLAASFLCQDFYVDDGVTSVESTETAIELVNEARKLCEKGNLHLHKLFLTMLLSMRVSQ